VEGYGVLDWNPIRRIPDFGTRLFRLRIDHNPGQTGLPRGGILVKFPLSDIPTFQALAQLSPFDFNELRSGESYCP
jgi:hypothetical protein